MGLLDKWFIVLSVVAFWFHLQMHCQYIKKKNKTLTTNSVVQQNRARNATIVAFTVNPLSEYAPARASRVIHSMFV